MVSKLASVRPPRLICCECGLDLTPAKTDRHGGSRRSQLFTIGLLALFALTAAGLMTLEDQHNPSLLNEAPLGLGERRQGQDSSVGAIGVRRRAASLRQ